MDGSLLCKSFCKRVKLVVTCLQSPRYDDHDIKQVADRLDVWAHGGRSHVDYHEFVARAGLIDQPGKCSAREQRCDRHLAWLRGNESDLRCKFQRRPARTLPREVFDQLLVERGTTAGGDLKRAT